VLFVVLGGSGLFYLRYAGQTTSNSGLTTAAQESQTATATAAQAVIATNAAQESQTATATTQDATATITTLISSESSGKHATGILTLCDFDPTPVTFQAGMVIANGRSAPAIHMMIDETVTVAGNNCATAHAHVVESGPIGNIPPVSGGADKLNGFEHCSNLCTSGWDAYNETPFSGG
jgi:hypothetical protein